MPIVHFTERQTERVRQLLDCFLSRSLESDVTPAEYKLALQVCKDMIDMQTPFTSEELSVISFTLDLYFAAFDSDDVDPLAEQAYAKITGYYPDFNEPWYDRVITHAGSVGYKPQYKYQRDYRLGY